MLRLWPEEAGDRLFVLDELTFVAAWARAIVYLREHEPAFRSMTVLLTGSSAFDLATSADLLHGRRGRWPSPLDRLHMTMTFRDYPDEPDRARSPPRRKAASWRHVVKLAIAPGVAMEEAIEEVRSGPARLIACAFGSQHLQFRGTWKAARKRWPGGS